MPVVLVLGYFHCTNLCETVMQTTLDALAQSGASRAAFRIVAVSIDPAETAADAHARRARDLADAELAWARAARGRAPSTPLDLQALVGAPAAVDLLAERAGFGFQRIGIDAGDPREVHSAATFVHAAGILVATPRGRIARYFLGVRPDPAALRVALDDAADESIGDFADRLVLLCAHLDPTLGRFSTAVLGMLRVLGVGLAGALGVWIWRHRRTEPPGRPA